MPQTMACMLLGPVCPSSPALSWISHSWCPAWICCWCAPSMAASSYSHSC